MRRTLQLLALVTLAFFSQQASALPGIQGVRWKTTYRLQNNTQTNVDIIVNNFQSASTYPRGSWNADGNLVIEDYQLDDQGRVSFFQGTWFRGGVTGKFQFSVGYQGSWAHSINGSYSSDQIGPVMYQWWGSR